jgi:hypothetical protein
VDVASNSDGDGVVLEGVVDVSELTGVTPTHANAVEAQLAEGTAMVSRRISIEYNNDYDIQ